MVRPRRGKRYRAGGSTVLRLTNTNRIEEGAWTVPSSIPHRYNSYCSRGAAAVFGGQSRQLAVTAIENDMHESRHDSERCYACYGEMNQAKQTESPDGGTNVTDVTDVTPNRRGCTCHAPARARSRPLAPVVDTPLNCRNIRNIRNIARRHRGISLHLPKQGVTCYGRWSA